MFRFLDNLKIWNFAGNCFWGIKILNFGDQDKNSKDRDSHFVERSILRPLHVTSKLCILAAFKHLPFLPKMWKHAVTKTPFSQKFLVVFFWNFDGRRQVDAGEGTKSFASISVAVLQEVRERWSTWYDDRGGRAFMDLFLSMQSKTTNAEKIGFTDGDSSPLFPGLRPPWNANVGN